MDSLLVLLPIVVLTLTAILLITVRFIRPGFQYHWLIAASGSLLAWFATLISRSNIPQTVSFFYWQPDWLEPYTPGLLLDQYSWSYAICLVTLTLSVILTDAARRPTTDWSLWVGGLFLTALGVSAVLAESLLTLLLFWTAIDLIELLILLGQLYQSEARERAVIAFFVRLTGTFLLIWAVVSTSSSGSVLNISQMPPETLLILLIAAGLRLGVLPINQPYWREIQQKRSLGTIGRMNSAAASLILLTRIALVGIPGSLSGILLTLSGLAALYGAFSWTTSDDALEGRPYWILGMSAFSVASAIRALPYSSLAWGELAILSGGLIFLNSLRNRFIVTLSLFGFIGLACLPFTPGWNTTELYHPPYSLGLLLLLLAQSVFAVGYLHFIFQPGEEVSGLERWVWFVYPWGLLLLPLSNWLIAWFEWRATLNVLALLPAILVGALIGLWIYIDRELSHRPRLLGISIRIGRIFVGLLSLRWLYRSLWRLYFFAGRMIRLLISVMEGDGGVLWALLILVLFIAILSSLRWGG